MKIAIMTDSSADISKSEESLLNVYVVRDPITIDGQSEQDEVTISRQQLINYMNQGLFAKTSAPLVGEVLQMFEKLLESYDHVLYFPIASDLASAYQTGVDASQQFEGKVSVIDHHCVSFPLYTVLKDTHKLIEKGLNPQEIKETLESSILMDALIIPENMEYLKKGGRVSSTTAIVGDFLKIIPILRIKNSVISSHDKTRTYRKAFCKIVQEMISLYPNPNDYHYGLVYGDLTQDEVNHYKDEFLSISQFKEDNLEVRPLNAVIMCHTGPKVLGITVSKKIT